MASARTHHRTCSLCEAMCGIVVEHRDGEVLSIKPNRDDVLSRGHICPKAVALKDLHEDPDRLRTPAASHGRRRLGGDFLGRGVRRDRGAPRRDPRAARQRRGRDLRRQPDGAQPRRDARHRRFHPRAPHEEPLLGDQRRPAAAHGRLVGDVRAPVPDAGAGRRSHAAVRLHRRQPGRLGGLDHGRARVREAHRRVARARRPVRRHRSAPHRVGRDRRRIPAASARAPTSTCCSRCCTRSSRSGRAALGHLAPLVDGLDSAARRPCCGFDPRGARGAHGDPARADRRAGARAARRAAGAGLRPRRRLHAGVRRPRRCG